MSALYDDFAAAAIEMLSDPEIGQAITLKRPATGDTYDEDSGTVIEGSPETYPGFGVVFDYKQNLIDGTNILQGDQLIYMAPDLGVTPEAGDTLILADGTQKQVIDSQPLKPAGQIVLHQMQARDV
jgi:hypothetical protein